MGQTDLFKDHILFSQNYGRCSKKDQNLPKLFLLKSQNQGRDRKQRDRRRDGRNEMLKKQKRDF